MENKNSQSSRISNNIQEEYEVLSLYLNESPDPVSDNIWYWAKDEHDKLKKMMRQQEKEIGSIPLYSDEPAEPQADNVLYWARDHFKNLTP